MTLDEWCNLTSDERNRLRREWGLRSGENRCHPYSREWDHLVYEATERFRIHFGKHPLITDISPATGIGEISVTTLLLHPQILEELPDRYCTFRVTQQPIEGNKRAYLRTWTLVLGGLLGWAEQQVLEWAEQHRDGLEGRDHWFYHEDEYYYVIPQILWESTVVFSSARERSETEMRVRDGIRKHGSSPLWLSPYDWSAARERINAILVEHGGKLPARAPGGLT